MLLNATLIKIIDIYAILSVFVMLSVLITKWYSLAQNSKQNSRNPFCLGAEFDVISAQNM